MRVKTMRTAGKWRAAALFALAGLAVAATTAAALVKVYSNDFSSSTEADQLLIEGKGCDKVWDKENKRLVVVAKQGPARCRLKAPVQGDSPQPNQAVLVTAKLDKDIANSVAKKTYLAISLRDGAGGLLQLRLYPALRRVEVHREPGANGFPFEARDKSIGRPGDRNFIRMEANENTIKVKVNKAKFEAITDPNPSELEGRRITLQLISEAKTSEPISAWFDDFQVQVPNP